MRKLLIILLPVLFITSCGMIEGKSEAEKIAKKYFDVRIEKDSLPFELLSDLTLRDEADSTEWKRIIQLVQKANGKTKSYTLNNWSVNSQAHFNTSSNLPNGTNVTLVYKVDYDNGAGYERITINKPIGDNEYKIVRINYQSDMIEKFTNESIQEKLNTDDSGEAL